jgi:hypothetical protein
MNQPRSISRRVAGRLAAHAQRVMPAHRSDWARALRSELEYLDSDAAALRWAAGAVVASYLERARSFDPTRVINTMRSLFLSSALVFGGLLFIESSHVFFQFLLQDEAVNLLVDNLPASILTTDSGVFVPLGIILTIVISAPVAVVALLLGRKLIHSAPARARKVIGATIVSDAVFVAGAILINYLLLPDAGFQLSTVVLWLIRVLFVALPLLILLRMNRTRLDAATG